MSEPDFLITPDDLRNANICAKGARQWFKAHGLDYSEAVANKGLPASVLRGMDDPYAKIMIETAERRIAAEGE